MASRALSIRTKNEGRADDLRRTSRLRAGLALSESESPDRFAPKAAWQERIERQAVVYGLGAALPSP
jgi:hypothetical protein